MKNIGLILFMIGAIWAIIAFNADISVSTRGEFIGGHYIPSTTVNNIGLMDDRRNNLMMSAVMVLVGVILFAVSAIKSAPELSLSSGNRKCPYCAEIVKSEAVICRYCNNNLEKIIANNHDQNMTKPNNIIKKINNWLMPP